ncbi:hypothetical protein DNTS_017957 [Danionella cerebrum]|uniref:AAA+ ATPase domain-containing protein n=1 Tax=Danionella cerebrum TaxID=2873325 RepID=A0A553PJ18_9TELE|nr:hypothetical protein DNTS_017957 [Danionella translucida]TRY77675.1 hypothetical protein DNTS_017957 [Danionella translucida]
MDEYDEMYGIEDDFEQQFADELEAMAEMENENRGAGKVSEFRNKPIRQTFEAALESGDMPLMKPVHNQHIPEDIPPHVNIDGEEEEEEVEEESLTPKPKKRRQDVVKKLEFGVELNDITPPSSPETYVKPSRDGRRHAQKRPPAIGDFITVTDSLGNRVYLNKTNDEEKVPDSKAFRNSLNGLGLLAVPIEVLKEQVAERRHRHVMEESQRLTELLNSGLDSELLVEEQTDSVVEGDGGEDGGASSRLWVDQFSPKHYTDLLSDDFTNRCLLKWLKLWDTVVFGRERKQRQPPAEGRSTFTSAQKQNQAQRFKTKSQVTEEILEAELDQYKRPKFKVALLSGPPGLGKTTLAHIIAKHAGYNVVEINASDDRSAELFQKRIDTATQMKSVLGTNEKPNCLIIDEIDGAPAAAINILLATLNRKDNKDGEESGANPLKKKKKKQSVLLRPIICICNDLYVPALRPLRQQAFLLAFPQTLPSRLVQRLAEVISAALLDILRVISRTFVLVDSCKLVFLQITRRQGMKADTGTLMALCEKTDNDIRSCINTLQFLHGRGQKQLDQRTVSSMCVGLKDHNKGLFSVWQEIFQLPRQKRKRIGGDYYGGYDEVGPKDGAQHLQHILHLVSSAGEHEKLTQGLYDNFLSMKLKDPGMLAVCTGLDWLCFSDLLNECVLHGQNYSLMRYFPFLPAAFHHLYAATSVPRINYPHSHYEAFTKTQHIKNALLTMLNDIPAAIQNRLCISSLCLDILSLLLELISPKLRPVNPQLYSSREKQQLSDLIDTMINYNLTYRQDRTPEGQYVYILEPRQLEPWFEEERLCESCRFASSSVMQSVLAVRCEETLFTNDWGIPLLVALLVLLLIYAFLYLPSISYRAVLQQALSNHSEAKTVEAVKQAQPGKKADVQKQMSRNHQQRLENIVKQTVVESRPELDFFGRAVVPKEKPVITITSEDGKVGGVLNLGKAVGESDVWFRFNEGVSNAVRRNVYIRELL